jgi:hypothetical protein
MQTITHLHRNRAVAAVLLLLAGRLLPAQIGLGLSPMRVELRMQPGMEQSGVLLLNSDSGDKVRVRAQALDFLIDDMQVPQFEPRLAAESEFSCRDWLSVNPAETIINAGKQLNVRYTVRVPAVAQANRGYHCALGFTTLPTDGQVGVTGIRTAVQVVAALYITTGAPGIEGQFSDLKLVHSLEPPHWVGVVVLQNSGVTHFRPTGELSVLDLNDRILESVALTPLPALPKREQRYLVPFTRELVPGTYKLRARVDIGNNRIEEGTAVVRAEE